MDTTDIIKKVRRIDIRTRRLVTESVSGAYYSSFKGRGMDFEEVREYAIGDEVRTIDWNVSAKMDRPYVKVFREERELTVMLLVDVSASGIFGSSEQSKRERAAELASVIAYSAAQNNDKVGILLFTDDIEHYIPPRKGRRHILRIIRDLLAFEPQSRKTNLETAFKFLRRVQKKRCVTFLISDFLDCGEDVFRTLARGNRRHDLISLRIRDPRESELPKVGLITLQDAETGEVAEINTNSKRVREQFAKQQLLQDNAFTRGMRMKGLDWIEVTTDRPYISDLQQLFIVRAARY